MVRAVVSRPAGRAVSTERRAAGARDNLSAAPATWLSILGLLRAPPAPLQLPRHPRVSQPLDLLPPRIGSLGPVPPPPVRSPPAGDPGLPWHAGPLGEEGGAFGKGGRRRAGGRAAGCSGSPWGSHGACIPRGPAAASLPATGDSARERPEATPLSPFPGPRDPSSASVSRPRGLRLEPGSPQLPPSPPQAGVGWGGCSTPAPGALSSSPCPHLLRFLNRFRRPSGLFTL